MLPTERLAYSPITKRKPLALPNGARMVVWTITNVEEWDATQPMPRTVLSPPAGGSAHRTKYFRRIFETIRKKRDVLFWNGGQILDWYLKAGPAAP
jgi:hypothetical protein